MDHNLISFLDVIKPLLNIYCTSLHQRVFVREIFTYKVLLRNPHSDILHLSANVGNCDGFMLAGHKQLTLTIFPHCEYELTYNLYPLKSNFQRLPEIKLEIKNYNEEQVLASGGDKEGENNQQSDLTKKQSELNDLLERWLPKLIFVHPPNRKMA